MLTEHDASLRAYELFSGPIPDNSYNTRDRDHSPCGDEPGWRVTDLYQDCDFIILYQGFSWERIDKEMEGCGGFFVDSCPLPGVGEGFTRIQGYGFLIEYRRIEGND